MSLSFAANFGSVDSLRVRTRCGASRCPSGCVAPNAGSRQPLSPASDRHGCLARWRAERQIDHPLHAQCDTIATLTADGPNPDRPVPAFGLAVAGAIIYDPGHQTGNGMIVNVPMSFDPLNRM